MGDIFGDCHNFKYFFFILFFFFGGGGLVIPDIFGVER